MQELTDSLTAHVSICNCTTKIRANTTLVIDVTIKHWLKTTQELVTTGFFAQQLKVPPLLPTVYQSGCRVPQG